MNKIETEILQEGVDFKIVRNKNYFFLNKEKEFIIYPLCLGTMLKISKIINSISDLKDTIESDNLAEIAIRQIEEQLPKVSRIIALSIFNRKLSRNPIIRFFQEIRLKFISNFMLNNLDAMEMQKLISLIIKQLEVQHFLAVLVSLKGMTITPEEETAKDPKETAEKSKKAEKK